MTCGYGCIDAPDDGLSAYCLWLTVKCPAVRGEELGHGGAGGWSDLRELRWRRSVLPQCFHRQFYSTYKRCRQCSVMKQTKKSRTLRRVHNQNSRRFWLSKVWSWILLEWIKTEEPSAATLSPPVETRLTRVEKYCEPQHWKWRKNQSNKKRSLQISVRIIFGFPITLLFDLLYYQHFKCWV